MDKYPSKEEIKEYKKRKDIVLGSDPRSGLEKLKNIYMVPKLKNIHSKGTASFLMLSDLYSDNKEHATSFLDRLHIFCWDNTVSILGATYFLMGFDYSEASRIRRKKIKLKTPNDIKYNDVFYDIDKEEAIKLIYSKIIDVYGYTDRDHDISKYPKFFQQVLINSYDEIRDRVVKNIENTFLPLDQQNLDTEKVLEEISHMKEHAKDKFKNKHSLAQIKQDTHFLSYLKEDDIEITDDYNLIFSGHTLGLSMGYTDKAVLLSLDRKATVRELKSNLKYLQKYKNTKKDAEEQMLFTEQLIEFIGQNKTHANYIPYKALAKHMGISKNKVKRYAKEFIGINEKSFLKNFDSLKTYTS